MHRKPHQGSLCLLLFLVGLLCLSTPQVCLAHLGVEHPKGRHEHFTPVEFGIERVSVDRIVSKNVLVDQGRATDIAEAPDGSGRVFFITQRGHVFVTDKSGTNPTLYLDATNDQTGEPNFEIREGATSLAFHPGFGNQQSPGFGKFYTLTDELSPVATPDFRSSGEANKHGVLTEWTMTELGDTTFSGSSREIMRTHQKTRIHNLNDMAFGPDNMMYIVAGDDGHTSLADNTTSVYGKVLRIDPLGNDSANGNYGIPSDNPFLDLDRAAKEVFATGFRNPYRIGFDRATGDIYVGDVGTASAEEIDLVIAGQNYGWPVKEGSLLNNGNDGLPDVPDSLTGQTVAEAQGLIDPLFEYDHTQGTAIIGGVVYRGNDIPWMQGKYVFTDAGSGNLVLGDLETGEMSRIQIHQNSLNYIPGPVSVGEDVDGELFVLSVFGISRILPSPDIAKTGDFNGNGQIDTGDVDLITRALYVGMREPGFDLDDNGVLETEDQRIWLEDLAGSVLGDSNFDGRFDSSDLTNVFEAGQYEDNDVEDRLKLRNSTFATGDWNGDREFDSADLVVVFKEGQYISAEPQPVPEPTSILISVIGLVLVTDFVRRNPAIK